jgi:nucleoside-diphosphate-sugar epimerase
MRILVAGATGAVGRALMPRLVRSGHTVFGMARSAARADSVRNAGAVFLQADALDFAQVSEAVAQARPHVVVHQLTAIPGDLDLRKIDKAFETTNLLRTRGTDHLAAAAAKCGSRRFVAQSFAGWTYARSGGPVKTEDDPLDPAPPIALRSVLQAIRHTETAAMAIPGVEGIVLRYGAFYGPGNTLGEGGHLVGEIRRRRVPLLGKGTGIWSFIHIDDAAAATAQAIETAAEGIYNIVDDEPAQVADWLPRLAAALGAPPPRRVPAWIARLLAGDHAVMLMNETRGASNRKARWEIDWRPRWASWREGFVSGLGDGQHSQGRSQAAPGRSGDVR